MGKKGILLGAIEAMDLVDEQNRPRAVLAGLFSISHYLLDFLDAGEHGGKLDELRLGDVGDDFGQRGLSRTGRSPEDDGAGIVALDLQAQRLARGEDLLLADELVESPRTHAVG